MKIEDICDSEVSEPLKLEVGRSYVDRRGETVMIVENCGGSWPFRGDNGQLYREDGSWDTTVGHECEFDLVKEVVTTVVAAESPVVLTQIVEPTTETVPVEPSITWGTCTYRFISASDSVANISREDFPAAI